MGVRSEGAKVADRSFQVFRRALHPEWFAVRAHERLEAGPWQADVRIVDGGHSVVFAYQGERITEVLGARDNALPIEGLLLNSPIRHERTTVLRPGGRLVYQVCLEVEQVDPEVFRHLCEEVSLDARRGRLFQAFPAPNRFSPRPLSHVRVDRLAGGICIQTFHSFPGDLAIFRSQSLVELESTG